MSKTPKSNSVPAMETDSNDLKDTSEICQETKRKYYYDDAFGYEVYDPANEEDDEE